MGLPQPEQNRVRDVADAGLQREQIRRHAALLHLPAQELKNMARRYAWKLASGALKRAYCGQANRSARLPRPSREERSKYGAADALAGMHEGNRHPRFGGGFSP